MKSQNSSSNAQENGLAMINSQFSQFDHILPVETEQDEKTIKDYLGVFKRQALVITGIFSAIMIGVTYSTITAKPIYQGNFQLLVEPVDNDGIGQLTLTDSNPIPTRGGLDYESQIQVLRSSEKLYDFIQDVQQSYPDITYNSLMKNLKINRLGQTKVIEVSYKSDDAKKIKFVLDKLSQYYLKYSLYQRQTKLQQGVNFVNAQLPEIQNRVAQTQKELQVFRQRYNFIDPENQASTISSQIQSLSQQRLTINQQIIEAQSRYLSLQQPEGQLVAFNSSDTYQQLITQQRQLETQISGELARFQPDTPGIITLQEKRNNLIPLIQKEARRVLTIKIAEATTILQKVDADSKQLMQAEEELKKKLNQLPVLTRQYTDIQRNLQLANESLTRFLVNRENLQIQVAQTELPWSLIQAAVEPKSPVLPNIPSNLLLGFVVSSLLGMGAALLMEEMDNTYHTIDKIKEKIKLPVLGTLPFDKSISYLSSSGLYSHEQRGDGLYNLQSRPQLANNSSANSNSSQNNYYGQGAFWESLQVLYSNIQLLNSDQPIHSLVISSSLPGDGKSTVSFHLAQIAASMGKKVLLVDADLRRPHVHELTQLQNLWGLSNLISTNILPEEIIQEMPNVKNLSVITSGPVPPDPARLLASDKMKQLMANFDENFDLVIYDAPPMLGLVDARLLAPYTNGVMLVVRMNKTDKSALLQLQDSLKVSPINILGIVANGDKNKMKSYNSYYNSYYKSRDRSVVNSQ